MMHVWKILHGPPTGGAGRTSCLWSIFGVSALGSVKLTKWGGNTGCPQNFSGKKLRSMWVLTSKMARKPQPPVFTPSRRVTISN